MTPKRRPYQTPLAAASAATITSTNGSQRAARKNVGAPVGGGAPNLFGRHIANRSEDRPWLGPNVQRRRNRSSRAARRVLPRQSEIENLDSLIRGDEYVLRFEIAVDDALV